MRSNHRSQRRACPTSTHNKYLPCTPHPRTPPLEMLFPKTHPLLGYLSAIAASHKVLAAPPRARIPDPRLQCRTIILQAATGYPSHPQERHHYLRKRLPNPVVSLEVATIHQPSMPKPMAKHCPPRLLHRCRRRHHRYAHRGLGSP